MRRWWVAEEEALRTGKRQAGCRESRWRERISRMVSSSPASCFAECSTTASRLSTAATAHTALGFNVPSTAASEEEQEEGFRNGDRRWKVHRAAVDAEDMAEEIEGGLD